MSEIPSGATEIHFRFLPSVFPLNLVQKTLSYRRLGAVEFIDLPNDSTSPEIIEQLWSKGLSASQIKSSGLTILFQAGLIEPIHTLNKNDHTHNQDEEISIVSLLEASVEPYLQHLTKKLKKLEVLRALPKVIESRLHVVIANRYDDPRLELISAELFRNRTRWVLIQIESQRATFGPMFGETDYVHCFQCFRARVESSLEFNRFSTTEARSEVLAPLLSWVEVQLSALAAGTTVGNINRSLTSFDPNFNRISTEHYLPAPLCEVCG